MTKPLSYNTMPLISRTRKARQLTAILGIRTLQVVEVVVLLL